MLLSAMSRYLLLQLLLLLPLTFFVRRRGHRCGKGCVLGRSLMEQLLLLLRVAAVVALAGVVPVLVAAFVLDC